jgi:hypothetical protein
MDGSLKGDRLSVANSIWTEEGKPFKASYLSLLSSGYSAPLHKVDFASNPGGATNTINQWISTQTDGLFTDRVLSRNRIAADHRRNRASRHECERPSLVHRDVHRSASVSHSARRQLARPLPARRARILARREPRAASACRPQAPSIHRRRATTACREGKGARPEATGRGGVPRDTRDDPALVSREGRGQVRRHRPAGSWASARARRRGRAAVDHGARESVVGLHAPSRRAPERELGPRALDDSEDPEGTRHRARARTGEDHAVEDVLKAHWGAIAAADFFSVEVLTLSGLVRYLVLFVIDLKTPRVHIAGITSQANGAWVAQIARNLTDALAGPLRGFDHLIVDREGRRCQAVGEAVTEGIWRAGGSGTGWTRPRGWQASCRPPSWCAWRPYPPRGTSARRPGTPANCTTQSRAR